MKRRREAILFLVCLIFCALASKYVRVEQPTVPRPVRWDRPFETADGIRLGMTREEIVARLGPPTIMEGSWGMRCVVHYDDSGRAAVITADSLRQDDVVIFRAGTSARDMLTCLGRADKERDESYARWRQYDHATVLSVMTYEQDSRVQCVTFWRGQATSKPEPSSATDKRPLIALVSYNAMADMGRPFPLLVLYEDGLLIVSDSAIPFGEDSYLASRVDPKAFVDSLQIGDDLRLAERGYATTRSSDATAYELVTGTQRISIYGEPGVVEGAPRPPPASVAALFSKLRACRPPDAKPWLPDSLEIATFRSYSENGAVQWPVGLPDLCSASHRVTVSSNQSEAVRSLARHDVICHATRFSLRIRLPLPLEDTFVTRKP